MTEPGRSRAPSCGICGAAVYPGQHQTLHGSPICARCAGVEAPMLPGQPDVRLSNVLYSPVETVADLAAQHRYGHPTFSYKTRYWIVGVVAVMAVIKIVSFLYELIERG